MKCLLAVVALVVLTSGAVMAEPLSFVGCASDGQLGPRPAPGQGSRQTAYGRRDADHLSEYAMSDGTHTLAPRGWHCGGLYGSDGSVLVVAPDLVTVKAMLAGRPVAGPAVVRRLITGDTSGRFEAGRIAAMLLPAASSFVAGVEAEGITKPFHHGLPAGDRITRLTPLAALFTTPAVAQGVSPDPVFAPGALPIDGMAVMSTDGGHDLIMMSARLAPPMRPLVADIISDMERELGLSGRSH